MQFISDQAGIDVLHIKGPAIDPSLTYWDDAQQHRPRYSTDADVLVRPGHEAALIRQLVNHGWRPITSFEDGSAFHHASSLWHSYLGYVDLHREFPGFEADPEVVFDRLWTDRRPMQIANWTCQTPSLIAQRVILILHTARGGRESDLERAWHAASASEREQMWALVDQTDAEVAFGVALGDLDSNRDRPTHELWELYATGRSDDRWAEWIARLRAARGPGEKVRELGAMLRLNRGHLEMDLGHPPSRREIVVASLRRYARAVSALLGKPR